jgi:endonuclease/exonuclease/phosphatase family metal-dependent hydrolase
MYNIYNDCKHDNMVEPLKNFHKCLEETNQGHQHKDAHTIWIGDFNRHYPHWDNMEDARLFTPTVLTKAEKLISAVADPDLDLALPSKIPTHKHNVFKRWTRLNHIFLTEHSFDTLISCEALTDSSGPNTDHLLILTKMDLTIAKALAKSVANF